VAKISRKPEVKRLIDAFHKSHLPTAQSWREGGRSTAREAKGKYTAQWQTHEGQIFSHLLFFFFTTLQRAVYSSNSIFFSYTKHTLVSSPRILSKNE
jgi:hypothetical protein